LWITAPVRSLHKHQSVRHPMNTNYRRVFSTVAFTASFIFKATYIKYIFSDDDFAEVSDVLYRTFVIRHGHRHFRSNTGQFRNCINIVLAAFHIPFASCRTPIGAKIFDAGIWCKAEFVGQVAPRGRSFVIIFTNEGHVGGEINAVGHTIAMKVLSCQDTQSWSRQTDHRLFQRRL
jgi:hypothetical protein